MLEKALIKSYQGFSWHLFEFSAPGSFLEILTTENKPR